MERFNRLFDEPKPEIRLPVDLQAEIRAKGAQESRKLDPFLEGMFSFSPQGYAIYTHSPMAILERELHKYPTPQRPSDCPKGCFVCG